MAYYTKAKDVFIQRRTSTGKFEEYGLIVYPNSFIMCDSCNDLVAVPSESIIFVSSSYALTASYALNGTTISGSNFSLTTGSLYPITSSWALTASFALNGGGSGTSLSTGSTYPITSSWAITASYVLNGFRLNTGSTYPITSSWAITSSYAISSLFAVSSDFAVLAGEAIHATSASYAQTASIASTSSYTLSSSYAITSSYSITSSNSLTSSNVVGSGTVQGSTFQITGNAVNYQLSSYTLINSDNGRLISINSSSTTNLGISRSLDATFNCMVYQSGSGQIVFLPESGINIRNRSLFTQTAGQYSLATLIRINNSDFILAGDLA